MASVCLIGCGNIGSHLAMLLARLSAVLRLILVDPDTYDASNLTTQNIEQRDLDRAKAEVLAERIRRARPALHVEPLVATVEALPPGRLRGADLIVAALDGNRARQSTNQRAARFGVPYVDAGVNTHGLLARVDVYNLADSDSPCIECGWHTDDYARLAQRGPCDAPVETASTNAPSHLGALAGALAAAECARLLEQDYSMVGRQFIVSADWHRAITTSYARNPACRFDHHNWSIETLKQAPADLTLQQTFALAAGSGARSLAVESQSFATSRVCPACGREEHCLELERVVDARRCEHCGGRLRAPGFAIHETLSSTSRVSRRHAKHSLANLGLQPGDLLTIRGGASVARHFELGGHGDDT